ncbi:UDP-2,4-diacetamido-2,4,6-trideoxy-beta-L-altropyranose hydrolase [Aequorivita viscosa]|uniref:UDP-2,4-diacetamido-2,4,6-trideoxy-beta-L-altropyranose hydrolase n=1 Tax=Aequorivita viscosa TaxID=797419 RepID=A0A1M6FP20_9FLAO|nr:UDP-2,4-diacetamido-2,4,6-trideoxy-beta-L-altropyranose hydrolase [Aequorivita viscosa]SDW74880.1 UDP-2,4-diacetamido-2,4,6-trideoxy-beta-L-altropyranose hydrolase [Aequorivita viscosa]SHI99437.1 UDP-2,4-diacetamido-2,4,6-trideoxy-beta-L-altropyranose hydrolase [Aequorivita viscosa]
MKKIFFRIDAGKIFGLGHLSRCLCLANEFSNGFELGFFIKTDNPLTIIQFIEDKLKEVIPRSLYFFELDIQPTQELKFLINEVKKQNAFLIIDHYTADEKYQKELYENNVKWLQFDSHAKVKLYSDFVLHGSPNATEELYRPLIVKNTKMLFGPKYAIVGEQFRRGRENVEVRKSVNEIFISFGGGNDKGALLKCISDLDSSFLKNISLNIVTSELNPSINEIKGWVSKSKNVTLFINTNKVFEIMARCDLAILTPGTLSYEASCMGLPMLLISTADNQDINASGWERIGAARYLGKIEYLDKNIFNASIRNVIENTDLLNSMSECSFDAVDGKGAERTAKIIKSRIV